MTRRIIALAALGLALLLAPLFFLGCSEPVAPTLASDEPAYFLHAGRCYAGLYHGDRLIGRSDVELHPSFCEAAR